MYCGPGTVRPKVASWDCRRKRRLYRAEPVSLTVSAFASGENVRRSVSYWYVNKLLALCAVTDLYIESEHRRQVCPLHCSGTLSVCVSGCVSLLLNSPVCERAAVGFNACTETRRVQPTSCSPWMAAGLTGVFGFGFLCRPTSGSSVMACWASREADALDGTGFALSSHTCVGGIYPVG